MAQRIDFTTPVGRLIGGSLYKGRTTDSKGQPRKYTSGPKVGQDKPATYDFGVAIPKVPGQTHWSQTEWGAKIYQAGRDAHPNFVQNPAFAWKITDGDSQVLNKNNRRPCDNEGYPGNWVLWFSSAVPPQIWNANGTERITQDGAVKPGYYVQVFGNATGNTGDTPGIYLNHQMVALSAYGPEIVTGADVSEAGFGVGVQLPPGASSVPTAALPPTAAPMPAATVLPPAVPVVAAPPPVPTIPVIPNPAALGIPAPHVMTAKAQGHSYETLIANGWTDTMLREQGLML